VGYERVAPTVYVGFPSASTRIVGGQGLAILAQEGKQPAARALPMKATPLLLLVLVPGLFSRALAEEVAPAAAPALRTPYRLGVTATPGMADLGSAVTLTVRLLDSSDAEIAAPADAPVPFNLTIASPSKKTPALEGAAAGEALVFAAGTSARVFRFEVNEPGLWRVQAWSPRLFDGSCVVAVPEPRAARARPDRVAAAGPSYAVEARYVTGTVPMHHVDGTLAPTAHVVEGPSAEVEHVPASVVAPTAPATPVVGGGLPVYVAFDRTTVRADGQAKATVTAGVLGADAPADVKVLLSTPECTANPTVIVIPPGQQGQATLQRTVAGDLDVKLLSATPAVDIRDGVPTTLHFIPPYSRPVLLGPSEIEVGEPQGLTIRLVGDDDRAIATLKDLTANVTATGAVLFGGGGSTTEATIQAGKSDASVSFTVTRAGSVRFRASIPDLQEATLEVVAAEAPAFPAGTTLRLQGPGGLDMGDTGTLLVQLVDPQGRLVTTRRPLEVALRHDGPVRVSAEGGTLAKGSSTLQIGLSAERPGGSTFTASVPGLDDATFSIRSGMPLLPFVLGAVGGLVGGGVACLHGKRKKVRSIVARLVTGAVTGFVMYWVVSAGLVGTAAGPTVTHPVGAIAVAMVGGWVGTGVLAKAASALGVGKDATSEKPAA